MPEVWARMVRGGNVKRLAIIVICLTSITCFSVSAYGEPKYLLALRYACQDMDITTSSYIKLTQENDAPTGYSIKMGWCYLNETYDSMEQVMARLKENNGWEESGVIGLWVLNNKNRIQIEEQEI